MSSRRSRRRKKSRKDRPNADASQEAVAKAEASTAPPADDPSLPSSADNPLGPPAPAATSSSLDPSTFVPLSDGPEPTAPSGPAPRRSRRRRILTGIALFAVLIMMIAGAVVLHEVRTSTFQARYIHPIAAEATYGLDTGEWPEARFPSAGPWNVRMGYTRIPDFSERLQSRGFEVTEQVRTSPRFQELMARGLNPPYDEKSSAGLELFDWRGESLFSSPEPGRIYESFDSLPELLWRSLLFIESRDFLDPRRPKRNPAVDWDRLARSVGELGLKMVGRDRNVPGGSTLATQIEKFRHSPGGLTASPAEKVRQMASASLRAYQEGEQTLPAQRRIILDYINSVPLSASPGFGEVTGIGDGLWAWFGTPFDEANRLFREGPDVPAEAAPLVPPLVAETEAGDSSFVLAASLQGPGDMVGALPELSRTMVYRQALSLMIAQRRPSWYLMRAEGHESLAALTDLYLRLMAEEGIIDGEFAQAALQVRPVIRPRAPAPPPVRWVEQKGVNHARVHLMQQLGLPRLYDLDRLDVSGRTTLDRAWQGEVLSVLEGLRDPAFIRQFGFDSGRLLERGDPSRVLYTVVLYERTERGNLLRVLADNLDAPLSLNDAGRLELGSTAKLRTLVTYLETIETLHEDFAGLPADSLRALAAASGRDPLGRWVANHLLRLPAATARETLDASMLRVYSANPAERFSTGGGVQTFSNFDNTYNQRSLTVTESFRQSVNLPFIRMMRDIVQHHMYGVRSEMARALEDADVPARQRYLQRFAHEEGGVFVSRFERKYRDRRGPEILDLLVERRLTPQRMAWAYRAVAIEADLESFSSFLRAHLPDVVLSDEAMATLFARSHPAGHTLSDLGVLASVHPLELWVARYLLHNPGATTAEVLEASAPARQDVYGWLFRTRRQNAQDSRIRTMLEMEAFQEIHRQWQRHGYPFPDLVPSFGTSIGSSGDRPAALAELVGIIIADGIRLPTVQLEEVRLAEGTPWETRFARTPVEGERVLSEDVARVTRAAMVDVVEQGTARRALASFRAPDGTPLVVGGKTGTGDNRFRVFAQGGREVESRVVNRTSTFVFFVGDSYFGTITAYVPGPEAAEYNFTSGLPAQILRVLGPRLMPVD